MSPRAEAVVFWGLIVLLFIVASFLWPHPQLAMWFGFAVAGYSAIANDSIQTLGTFITSNKRLHWILLWLFVAGILTFTYVWGWLNGGGDIAFGRLIKIPEQRDFSFVMISTPIILLILTRLRMPVSTTFLLLSTFGSPQVIRAMLTKTFLGYAIALVCGLLVWGCIAYVQHREFTSKTYNERHWRILQACSTAFLWSTWIMHDTANVAVFLPRSLNLTQMLIAVGYLVCITGAVMYFRGGRIQVIVTEKTDITDVRSATIIDFTYALVLFVFKQVNNLPMSTTWVFLGLLAGREFALSHLVKRNKPYKTTMRLVGKDLVRASIGLLVSLLIVLFVNDSLL